MSNVLDSYQTYIHQSRYARWLEDKGRRETWPETVQRYVDFWGDKLDDKTRKEMFDSIHSLSTLPSMRALWAAGPALREHNMAGYNCTAIAIDHPRAFSEVMYVLMCGAGAGFSVERQFISKLPLVAEEFHHTDTTIVVDDSKMGWCSAFNQLIGLLYAGAKPVIDYSKIRPAGSRLKTMGGRASGPEPLKELFDFTIHTFQQAHGRQLHSLEVHDIVCKTGEIVIVGGVRRSALISLSSPSDLRMRDAKTGAWWNDHPQRALANNSAVYEERPGMGHFLDEVTALYKSYSGERGIVNREGMNKRATKYGRREPNPEFLLNPCAEVILANGQCCNLSTMVVRKEDDLESLLEKATMAAITGTLQSSLTDFKFVRAKWRHHGAERLLGVSMTGVCDHPVLSKPSDKQAEWLRALREQVVKTNKQWAKRLGIEESVATTVIKPEGTTSQLTGTASGCHPRYAPYYIRRVRSDKRDPLTDFLISQGVPHEDCVMKPDNTVVFSFPIASPKGSICTKDMGPIRQLELVKSLSDNYTEHTVSATVYYEDHNFMDAMAWVYSEWDSVVGLSFLPQDSGSYRQAPYEEIDAATYKEMAKAMPDISWEQLKEFERGDTTEGAQTLACVAGACELV